MRKHLKIFMVLSIAYSICLSSLAQAVMMPEFYEKRERESKIKAIAMVEQVEVVAKYPERGVEEKKVTFRSLRTLTGEKVPETFTGYCYSVIEGKLPAPGGTIYCYPIKGLKVYVAIDDNGGTITGYSAITDEVEKRIIDEYEQGEPNEYVLRW